MRTPSLTAALVLAASLAPSVGAQPAFSLDAPVLIADGRRVPVEGAPLRQERFGTLVLSVPGLGTYTVADEPFEGARRAGEFEGASLVFASEGVSVRLLGGDDLLGGDRRPAFVRAAPSRAETGPARVALGGELTEPPTPRRPSLPDAAPEPQPTPPTPQGDDTQRPRREATRLEEERDALRQREARALQTDLARVTAERDALRDERDRAMEERRALADALGEARREAERERERRETRDAQSTVRETDARRAEERLRLLRRELVARDEAIERLTAERDDRSAEVARLSDEVARLSADLESAQRQRDDAREQTENALAEAAEARRELEAARAATPAPDLAEHEREQADLASELDALRAELNLTRGWLQDSEAARLGLEADLATLRARAERPASRQDEAAVLRAELDSVRAELARLRRSGAPAPSATPSATPSAANDGAVSLPGFDLGRLTNAAEVQRRLAESVPVAASSAVSGDVLVLFQTDPSGAVIRTAVPRPLGGGLDALAEGLVRAMAFETARVDGQPTGIRSQVLVRFRSPSGS